jgi:sodium-dependent dicarboxylate transporter 2/3/5
MELTRKIGLFAGPIVFLILSNLPFEMLSPKGDAVIAVTSWILIWWILEAVSISVTSLLPLLLFPIMDILPMDEVGANYASPVVFLFFGGFIMALALEKVNLHRRIALNIIKLTGTSPNQFILGFMIATAVLSMWISNTATAVVMLPIALSVINLLVEDGDGFTKDERNFALSVILGIAFGANTGGMATIIGSPPNSIMVGFLENEYQIEISFLQWMSIGVPFSFLMLGICYWVLVKWLYPNHNIKFNASKDVIQSELEKLGPISGKERMVMILFGLTVFLWVFRTLINVLVPGLGLSDPMIAIFAAMALFCLPYNLRKGDFILQWKDTSKLAWGILILFGGGLAIAQGMSSTGIVDHVALAIGENQISVFLMASLLIVLVLFLTEVMSNTALVALVAPMLAGIAIGLDQPMVHLLIPITLASSCAFMLPMATPPNAIVFASGYVTIPQMARAGILLNLLASLLLILVFQFVMPLLF